MTQDDFLALSDSTRDVWIAEQLYGAKRETLRRRGIPTLHWVTQDNEAFLEEQLGALSCLESAWAWALPHLRVHRWAIVPAPTGVEVLDLVAVQRALWLGKSARIAVAPTLSLALWLAVGVATGKIEGGAAAATN